MLKSLVIENVKGKSGEFAFGKITRLLGRNEVGKTGIKDAICYAFSGADSVGTRNPRHLITNGADGMMVTVVTDRSSIHRTLTQKGSQSLSIVRGGVRTPCSQEQLSKALGASPDLFLSSFLPGYFMTLSEDKRRAVLNEVLPPLDRRALLQEQLGFPLEEDDLITLGDLSRRPDLIAGTVSVSRRAALGQYNQIKGQVESYTAMSTTAVTAPADTDAPLRIAHWEGLSKLWEGWGARHNAWKQERASADQARAWNAKLVAERAAVQAELATIKLVEVPTAINNSKKVAELYGRLSPEPAKPAVLSLPEGDRCPCCGQVVGSKHREKVRADTAAAQQAYDAECLRVRSANDELRHQINVLVDEELRSKAERGIAERANRQLTQQSEKLQRRLAGLVDRAVPDVGPEPEQPSGHYDYDSHAKAKEEKVQYDRAYGRYEHSLKQKQEAGHKLSELQAALVPLAAAVERYERIEAALGELPKRELALRAEQLTVNGYTFSLEGTTVTRGDGIPYSQLSTGAGMKADIMLCFKFNQLLGAKAPNVVFIDNADLVDVVPGDTPLQVFLAYVRPEIDKLVVEAE